MERIISIFQSKKKAKMEDTKDQITQLEEKLNLHKALQNITNRVHAAYNIKQILVDLRSEILTLFDAHSLTIYVADNPRQEIFSIFLAGSNLTEIRVQVNNKSIAGYVANNRKAVNISDAYDQDELQAIDKELHFDSSWDQKSGFRTTQVLAVPVLHNNHLMGVIQILNKKSNGKFTQDDRSFLEEIAKVLGVAFHNQQRIRKKKKSKFDYLTRHGILSVEDLEKAWTDSKEKKETIEDHLMNAFNVSKSDIVKSFEEFYNCEFVSFDDKCPVPFDLLNNLKEEYLRRELWVPLEKKDGKIRILIDDPYNILKRDMIETLLKTKEVTYDVALYGDIKKYIRHFFHSGDDTSSLNDLIEKIDLEDSFEEDEEDYVTESDSIIMQLVNRVIDDAYKRGASDIHIEPSMVKKNVEIRFRIDGDLIPFQTVPFTYRAAIISRIKIMSNLDITERRMPQDGKIKFKRPGGTEIELRVATIPTQGSVEDVVMRILAKGDVMSLKDIKLSSRNYDNMARLLEEPYGILLVVGPTGSGKTTTLHASLKYINRPEKKIWTAEDPVEITQYGLRQVQTNSKIGFDFAHAMRSFLRADPDVIMVGEMRDHETAKIGIEASLTGHLVFSTLHTNSAPETIVRLLDMGIDPLNFADSLLGILAQRLVRTLCPKCKEEYHPDKKEYDEIAFNYGEESFTRLEIPYNESFTLFRAKGCSACDNTGYKGRMGIHEFLVSSPEVKRLIQKRETVEVIKEMSMSQGMTTLLQDGIEKILQGFTDIHQVRRVCMK